MLLCIGIFVVQVPWYLVRCRRILLERLGERRSHWAQLPLAIVFTTWMLAIVRTLDCAFIKWPATFSAVIAVVSVGVTTGALYLLLRQFGALAKEQSSNYAKSPLGPGARGRIRRKLETALADESTCANGELTLRSLCDSLNESPHYVSQVISQDLNSTFYDLLNQRRVEAALRRLRESPDETVLAIAMAVGFNSKSAFHSAFRRVTGRTPSDYRRNPGEYPPLDPVSGVLADQEGRQIAD
jgi:AraC-like DNA-binding protein